MKKLVLLFMFFCQGVVAQTITFDKELIDLGKIKYKDGNVDFEYKITNTGDEPLVLLSVDVSCDCTNIEYTKKPIMPKDTAVLKLTYKTEKTVGAFYKAVQLYANTEQTRHVVAFKGEIIK